MIKREKTYLLRCAMRLKSSCASAKSDQSLHEEIASLAIQNVPTEDSDDCVSVRIDLNVRWAHVSDGMFSVVVAQLFMLHTT